MSNFILITVENNINRFIKKCRQYNFSLHNIKYLNKNTIIVKIYKKDYENIKTYNYYSKIDVYRYLGKDNIINIIKLEKYYILTFVVLLLFMYLISNVIVEINVIHSSKRIRNLVYEELKSSGIKKFSIKKDFKDLEKIKNDILNNNKDDLEWISITNVGMKYIVRVEERIKTKYDKKESYCNIISKKDALITNIYTISGEEVVKKNDYVKKGDILISGDIILNDEKKASVCARGIVRGNVWYNTTINIKRNYYEKKYTGKKQTNFIINNKILRNNKYINYDKKFILKKRYIKIYKELEYKLINKKYSKSESVEYAKNELKKKFNNKLSKEEYIVDIKILNKDINTNNCTINFFVVTNEVIGIESINNDY